MTETLFELAMEIERLRRVVSRLMTNETPTGSTDSNAIHDNVAGEINAITQKTPVVAGDLLLIEDSADGYNKKKIVAGDLEQVSDVIGYYSGNGTASTVDIDVSGVDPLIYQDILIVAFVRTDRAANELEGLRLRLGDAGGVDTGNNYAILVSETGDATNVDFSNAASTIQLGRFAFTGATADANRFGLGVFTLANAFVSGKGKSLIGHASVVATSSFRRYNEVTGHWNDTDIVTTLRFFTQNGSNIVSGSYIKLIGLRQG